MLVRIDIPAQENEYGPRVISDTSITTSVISNYDDGKTVITILDHRVTNPTETVSKVKAMELQRPKEGQAYILFGKFTPEDGEGVFGSFELKVNKVTVVNDFPAP